MFSPEIINHFSENELTELIKLVEKEVIITAEQMNASFHKSWDKVRNASIEQLVLEQILHYFTTYGYEALGIYDKDSVYIPIEELNIPDVDLDRIKLTVIRGYTKIEMKDKVMELLKSGIALAEDTIKDLVSICLIVGIDDNDINLIKNKEVSCILCDALNKIPSNPTEFLRYLIYKEGLGTLLIKNPKMILGLKEKNSLAASLLISKYGKEYGLNKLAEIFYRFKPLWLAFKGNSATNKQINKIRKLADKYHKPMKKDLLNNITSMIKQNKEFSLEELDKSLSKVNIFRKIRLANSLRFRIGESKSILYKIRNGKGYAKESKQYSTDQRMSAMVVYKYILNSIVKDIKKNVEGKFIYIPECVDYTLPASEKQFTGNLPCGTCITVDKDMIFGIHWENVKSHRIDLDLSTIDQSGSKFGWDGNYRNSGRTILFSGDITDAPLPRGASELFYVAKQGDGAYLLNLNYYNFEENVPVPFKILVGTEKPTTGLNKNHTIDPNNVLVTIPTKIDVKHQTLGLVVTTKENTKFYLNQTSLSNRITTHTNKAVEHSRNYLFDYFENTVKLKEVLGLAGAKLLKEGDILEEDSINLSPEALEKDTIINLLN